MALGLLLASPVHQARAAIDGSLKVTSPNGGEVYTEGETHTITWDSSPNIDTVAIGWSSGPGSLNWIKFSTPNTGSYTWNVDVGNTSNTQFLIEVIGYDTGVGSLTDLSDNYFTVYQKSDYPTNPPQNPPAQPPVQTPAAAPTISLSADSTSLAYNSGTTIRWQTQNASSCTAGGAWSGSKSGSGSQSTGNLTGTRTYTLTCNGSGGTTSENIVVSVAAPVNNNDIPVAQPKTTSSGKGSSGGGNVTIINQVVSITSITQIILANIWLQPNSETTALKSIDDPKHVDDFTLDAPGKAKVEWTEPVDATDPKVLAALDNLDQYLIVDSWFCYFEFDFWAYWSVPVDVTFYNDDFVAPPVVEKDGKVDDSIKVELKDTVKGKTVVATVDEAAKYKLKHAIRLDDAAPVVATSKQEYKLSGTVSDPKAKLAVTLNGEKLPQEIAVDQKTGRFETVLSLILGSNQVALAATGASEIQPVSQTLNVSKGGGAWMPILAVILVLGAVSSLVWKKFKKPTIA